MPNKLIEMILPNRCPVCGIVQAYSNGLCHACWDQIQFISEPVCQCCGLPFEINPGLSGYCATCLQQPPDFNRARAVFCYDAFSRKLILDFKYGDRLELAPLFANWMLAPLHQLRLPESLLIPVPLHARRLFQRRFNQSAELAKSLSRLANLEIELSLLKRIRSTTPQGRLSARARQQNLQGAIAVVARRRHLLKDRPVLLIDDVLTSGATAQACSRALKQAGASSVDILCLARRPKPLFSLTKQ